MFTLDQALDLVQFIALLAVSAVNGVIAYWVFKIQKDRNTSKLVVYTELVEEDDREYYGLYVQNIGLVPALNVQVVADIEDWREGHPVRSEFHERYDAFQEHIIMLNPQEHRLFELPTVEEWTIIVTAIAFCSNGPSNNTRFMVGEDPFAFRQVYDGKERRRAIKNLKARALSKKQRSRGTFATFMGLTSLKDYYELFGDKPEVT